MKFSLDTTTIFPEKDQEIKNAIILLHGYGGDGNDISALSLNWKRFLPNTIFLCPNGHEKCKINPLGYQWFDLSVDDPKYILEESLKAEEKIKLYIDLYVQKYHNLKFVLHHFYFLVLNILSNIFFDVYFYQFHQ